MKNGAEAIGTLQQGAFIPWFEQWIARILGALIAVLVVVEVLVLFAGILARYVFHLPLVWSDELASTLFLWLTMLGAALALMGNEHMTMSALVNTLSAERRAFMAKLAWIGTFVFFALLLVPSIHYVQSEASVIMPSLGVNQSWRTMAMPTGIGLMLLLSATRLISGWDRQSLLAAAIIAALIAVLWLLQPLFPPLGKINLVIFFAILVPIAVFAALPIAAAFGLATFAYLTLTTRVPAEVIVARLDAGMSHLVLLSVPLFIFLGMLIELTGMARVMVAFLASLIGHLRGGLHYVLIAAMYLVSGISGSKAADIAAVAPVLFPEMEKRGADRNELVALLAATGAQTETIPPSLVLLTIGSVTGVSIAALFTGGLLPAFLLGLMLCAMVWYRWRGTEINIPRASGRTIIRSFVIALPALFLPFVIRFSVAEGIATATEVSTIGIVYASLAGILIYREFDFRRMVSMLVRTGSLSGAIMLIIGAATAMAWALTQSGFSFLLVQSMSNLPGGAYTFLIVSIVLFIILGSVLEGIPAIVLFAPLLFPVAKALGINEVHYAMVVILAMGLGLFAPPFGVGFYVASAIGKVRPEDAVRHIWPFMAVLLLGLLIVAAVPWISTGFL
ncbi:MAG: TRAP transporter large permease subunit [Rhizobiaceae bacterium]|nr:TRAP transporter large permease subunit [Rhizobiaceae bacterium]